MKKFCINESRGVRWMPPQGVWHVLHGETSDILGKLGMLTRGAVGAIEEEKTKRRGGYRQ
jgi:hypothetical protein